MASSPHELYAKIGKAVIEEAPQLAWAELHVTYVAAGRVSEFKASANMVDGSRTFIDPNWDLQDALEELRSAMYDSERGIWYTAQVIISQELRLSIDFDYDHEPEWGLAISPLSYAEDLELFPRHEDAIPDWLRQRLTEARS